MIRPLISEKSLRLVSRSWYTFLVDTYARKEDIAREIETLYSVNVLSVRTVTKHGKVRRSGKKMISRKKPDSKKAIVQLKAGQHIDAFEVTQNEAPAEEKKTEKKVSKK